MESYDNKREENEPVSGIKRGDDEAAEFDTTGGAGDVAKRRKNTGIEAVMADINLSGSGNWLILCLCFAISSSFHHAN